MKGFAITTDAVVAISFFLFAIVVISSQVYYPRAPGSIYLKQLTMDTLTVLEKSGRLDMAMGGNSSAAREVLEATPTLACMYVTVSNATGSVVAELAKGGCDENDDLDIQATTRPMFYNRTGYVVRSEAWFRKEPEVQD
jgi:hypothetical protein